MSQKPKESYFKKDVVICTEFCKETNSDANRKGFFKLRDSTNMPVF